AAQGQHRACKYGYRMRERAELDEQGDEDQRHGQRQRQHQLAEARLLLAIKPAVFYSHSRRQLDVLGERRLDSLNGAAEVSIVQLASPVMAVATVLAMSVAVTPSCAARCGSTLKIIAGPLIVTPLKTSTTPGIFSIAVATSSAFCWSAAVSSLKSLISIGSGELVRSPIRSVRMPGNSTRDRLGSVLSISLRRSSMTSSVLCVRLFLSLTRKSPVFGSVIDNPS